MRKILIFLVVMLMTFGIIGCGYLGVTNGAHTHEYSIKYDDDNHWKECECGEKLEIANHEYTWITQSDATCTEGEVLVGECNCGQITTKLGDMALGHTPLEAIKENEIASTCKVAGSYDLVVYCSVCNEEISRETITLNTLPHTEEVVPSKDATCAAPGLTEGKKCSVCDEVLVVQEEIPSLSHTPKETVKENEVASTCKEAGHYDLVVYCSVCNEEVSRETITLNTVPHTEEIIPSKDATCATSGLTEGKKCNVCNTVLVAQEVIPAKGHNEVVDAAVASTCTLTGLTEGKHCSVCNEVLVSQEVVPAKGHAEVVDEAVAADCVNPGKTEGKHCNVCNTVLITQEVVPAKGHTNAKAIKENEVSSTCKEAGHYDLVVYCSVCKVEVSRETINTPATNEHDFSILEYDYYCHWYRCSCGEQGTYEEHYGGIATEFEQASCELCGQKYGDLKLPEVPTEMYPYSVHLFKKFLDDSYYLTAYYVNSNGEQVSIIDKEYLNSSDKYWIHTQIYAPTEFVVELYNTNYEYLSSQYIDRGLYGQYDLWLDAESCYSYEEEFLKYHEVHLDPLNESNIIVDFDGNILTMSWTDEQQNYYDISYRVVITKNGMNEIASFEVSSMENGFVFNVSSFGYGEYGVIISTIGDEYITHSNHNGYYYSFYKEIDIQEISFEIINFTIDVNYVDLSMFSFTVSWDTSIDINQYTQTRSLSIPGVNYYNYNVYNGSTYEVHGISTEVSQIYDATLEISINGMTYNGYQTATTNFEVGYQTLETPIITDLQVDVLNNLIIGSVEVSGNYSEIQYGISDYPNTDYPSKMMYSTMETTFQITEYLEIRQESYYLMVRTCVYESAMPKFSEWAVYEFSYYIEPEQLATPLIKEIIWNEEEQYLEICFDTSIYNVLAQELYFEGTLANSYNIYTYAQAGSSDDAWLSFSSVTLESGIYSLYVQVSSNMKHLFTDSVLIYEVEITQKPIAMELSQVSNIHVEVLKCYSGEPAELVFIISWDEVYSELPITGVILEIEMQTGSKQKIEVYNGQEVTLRASTNTGVGVNMVGVYNCHLILKGDNYYSLDSYTYFEFTAYETE